MGAARGELWAWRGLAEDALIMDGEQAVQRAWTERSGQRRARPRNLTRRHFLKICLKQVTFCLKFE